MSNPKASIIVVDDEAMIVDQLEFYLGELGFTVVGFTDSVKASEVLKEQKFDILMTDLKMPTISGMDLVKIIRDRGLDTRIIIFTGFATTDSAIDAIKFGVYRYIRKPYDIREVGETVSDAAQMLYLERENAALNRKIQRMYNYITTLYDVCTILYQVTDLDTVIDMVLDTVTEALATSKVALLLPTTEGGEFVLTHSKGFATGTTPDLKLTLGDRINEEIIDGKRSLFLMPDDQQLLWPDGTKFYPDPVHNFILIPLRYREEVLGFFVIIDLLEDEFELKDKMQLLEILALQFAPVIFTQKQLQANRDTTKPISEIVEEVLDLKIEEARRIHTTLPVALIRFLPNEDAERHASLTYQKEQILALIKEVVDANTEVIWQSFDSILILKPGGNVVELEIAITLIQQKIEQLFIDDGKVPVFRVVAAVVAYPFDGRSAGVLINELNHRLFAQLKQVNKE